MPVQYPDGIIKEHLHTRSQAGLFDVSHMGQATLDGPDPASALERLTPADISGLKDGQQRYALLLNDEGGIKDDFMAARLPSERALHLVVNAATKDSDFAYIAQRLKGVAELKPLPSRALLALQGPMAEMVLVRHDYRSREARLHEDRPLHYRRRARDHQPLGIHGRGRVRDLDRRKRSRPRCPRAAWRKRSETHRSRRARFAPARGGAVPLRSRHRRNDDADRSGSRLFDRQAAQDGARLSRRRTPDDRACSKAPSASAWGSACSTRCPRAKGRRSWTRPGARSAASPAAASGRASVLRSPWAMSRRNSRADGTELAVMVRGAARPVQVAPMPFVPHRYKRNA